jgi:putative DNA primase/helicase
MAADPNEFTQADRDEASRIRRGWEKLKEAEAKKAAAGCNGKPAGPQEDKPPAKCGAHEAADDPHRLARVHLHGHERDAERGGRVPAEDIKLRYWRQEWHQWDSAAYRVLSAKEVLARLTQAVKSEFDRQYFQRAAQAQAEADGKKAPPVAQRVTTKLMADVHQALAGLTLLGREVQPPAWLSGRGPFLAHEVLAAPNALVHLPTFVQGGSVYSCAPTLDFFSFNSLDYDFSPLAPEPREWLVFLRQLWFDEMDNVEALQEWLGYLLTADTRQQKILLLVGPRRSGKGTLARVLRGLVGAANVAGPTLSSLSQNFGLQPLLDKTVAIISDARLGGRTDAAAVAERLLAISGEDAITVDRKNLAAVTAKLQVRFVLLANELPRVNDPSGALASRMILLRLTESWLGREDHQLTERLLAELPGILLWAIAGWKRLWQRGHFLQPQAGQELLEELEDLGSPMRVFLRECCVVESVAEMSAEDGFARWRWWCDTKGKKEPGTEQTFGRDLLAAVPAVRRKKAREGEKRYLVYQGLRLLW